MKPVASVLHLAPCRMRAQNRFRACAYGPHFQDMSDLRADAPAEVRFLFQDIAKAIRRVRSRCRWASTWRMFALAFWVAMNPSRRADHHQAFDKLNDQIVWLDVPGPGGGGGGGGNQSPEPVKTGRAQGQGKDYRAGRETAGDGTAQRQTAGRSHSEPDDSGADACIGRSRAGGRDGRHSDIRLARPRPRRRRGNRAGHRHRFGPRIWSWRRMGRRHRRRRVSSGQRRRDAAPAPRSEAAVHRAGDARENSGRSAARVHRPA